MHDEQERTPVTAPETGEADSAAAEFEELIQGRCKQPFQQRVQKILEGRLRTLRQENEAGTLYNLVGFQTRAAPAAWSGWPVKRRTSAACTGILTGSGRCVTPPSAA